ncbi:hypothetical protein M0R72_07350 [Candidatus Pacearchaeota archaeon]|jgi:hypothetical protein|nr:hypothetical protein [Candidatus Pacearchaeota archaeon]
MSEELNFDDLTTIVIPVKYQGKSYTLREADEAAACQYEGAKSECLKLANGEFSGVDHKSMAATEPLLVSLCLFDEASNNVPVEVVRSWPSRMVKKLFEKAKEISEIDVQDEETVVKQVELLTKQLNKMRKGNPSKNALSNTTTNSASPAT